MLLAGSILALDAWVNAKVVLLQSPLLSKIMMVITTIGNFWPILALSAIVFGVLAYKKKWNQSVLFVIAMCAGLVAERLMKIMVQRPRPENALFGAAGPSLPSGHATMALLFFELMIYLFKNDIKNKILRYFFIAGNVIFILLIGFSRVYFNVHWLSDVIAGFCLGTMVLILAIETFKRVSDKRWDFRPVFKKVFSE